ncbi:MAG: hypothetical protein R3200_11260 [Xanthomonadales bacterium]|nr:hypothetical protein [Xanthomonadales bacterium]
MNFNGLLCAAGLLSAPAMAVDVDSYTFGGVSARMIGPAVMSGRIASIDGVPGDPVTLYVGAASGGVWKSRDGGITFTPVFDDHAQSIGVVHVAPGEPATVWVGTGESWVRNSVSIGDGVYKSTDAGESWTHMGLAESEHVGAIRISPNDANVVFVCALGRLWSDNEERGVYRTRDGGETWEKVLHVDERTGCADLDMDPNNDRILYAAMWEFRRYPDYFESGGPGSGLYRSIDGGSSWERLGTGLPDGDLGRIAVAVAPSRSNVIYATVESDDTALYRSEDLGTSWERRSDSSNIQMRPFYFSELVVDPQDHQRVYKPGFTLTVSTDGGESFSSMFGPGFSVAIHPDHHALWIDPRDPQELVLGTDGGVYVSHDRATHWRSVGTLPVSQFYHVSHDAEWPYNVYGGLQDNGSWTGPSRSPGGIQAKDWDNVGFGDGFWVFVDPEDPNTIYSEYQGGELMRVDRALGEIKRIAPVAGEEEEELRFNWNTPLHLSSHRPGRIYYGSQYLHVSDDRGESWQTLSPDLTTDDPNRQRQLSSGGLTIDNSTAENNATIYTISESPVDGAVIWTGSDDGLIHVTRNGGEDWREVSIDEAPDGTWVSRVEASPHAAGTVFVTLDGHRTGGFATYVFRSDDFGKNWRALNTESVRGYAWVIKQDPVNPELLYLGTEFGLFLSLDGGANWARFRENLPPVAVHDIVIHPTEHDVILATHGRGVYIIDDITPVRALTSEVLESDLALLPSRPAVMVSGGQLQQFGGHEQFVGVNPPEAATISYYLKKRHMFGDLLLRIYDADGELITTLPGGKRRGINRVAWPMRLKPPKFPPSTNLVPGFLGPRVPEGSYRFELVKGKQSVEGEVALVPDPRSPHSAEDRRLQQELSLELYGMLNDLTYLVESLNDSAAALEDRSAQLSGRDARRTSGLAEDLKTFADTLVATSEAGPLSGEMKLREHLGTLYGHVSGYDGRPTATQQRRKEELLAELEEARIHGDELLASLGKINEILEREGLEPIKVTDREAWDRENGMGTSAGPAFLRGPVFGEFVNILGSAL